MFIDRLSLERNDLNVWEGYIYPVDLYSQHTYIDAWSFQIIQQTYIDSLHIILQPSNLDSSQIIHKT